MDAAGNDRRRSGGKYSRHNLPPSDYSEEDFVEDIFDRLTKPTSDDDATVRTYVQQVDAHDLKTIIELHVFGRAILLPDESEWHSHIFEEEDIFLPVLYFLDNVFENDITYQNEGGRIVKLHLEYGGIDRYREELRVDESIAQLEKLTHLSLEGNGNIPKELEALKNLHTLEFAGNTPPWARALQRETADSLYPAVELISIKSLVFKNRVEEDDLHQGLASWLSRSSFPNLETLTFENQRAGFAPAIVSALGGQPFPKLSKI
ncbi:MAG: hypothetical protein SGARI_007700, partial [Bacillariaceae sp.]